MFLMDAVKGMFCRLSAFKVFSIYKPLTATVIVD
jgi:hypothetical protein